MLESALISSETPGVGCDRSKKTSRRKERRGNGKGDDNRRIQLP